MSLTRRQLLSTAVFGGFSVVLPNAARGEATEIRASLVLQAEPAPARHEPPVVTCLAAQQGGQLVAVGGDDHLLRVWNTRTGQLVHRLVGHQDWIRAVQFVPGRDEIITAGNDRRLLRWTLSERAVAHQEIARHRQAITCICLSSDGRRLGATGFEPQLALYDLTDSEAVTQVACPCRDMRAAVFSPNSDMLASAGRNGRVRLWSDGGKQHVRDIDAHRQRIRALAFSPEGEHLVSASEDRTARIWEVATGEPVARLSSGTAKILCALYLDDRHLATGGSDNLIRIWDVQRREQISTLVGHTGSVATLARHNGKLISGSFDTTVRIWQPLAEANQAQRQDNLELLK